MMIHRRATHYAWFVDIRDPVVPRWTTVSHYHRGLEPQIHNGRRTEQ